MATGAGEQYWAGQALPSVFKHSLLERYVPQFAGMTGSRSAGHRVVFLDGYAGRGRYEDGSPASAERVLQVAERQAASAGLRWTCFFVEQRPDSAQALSHVVAEYTARGVAATVTAGDVEQRLPDVVREAEDVPLFLFLDPCGLGLPFGVLTDLLGRQRTSPWPPTEVLLNFSLEAVRRIGGHIASRHRNENSVRRLDAAVDGDWWHSYFTKGVTDEAVELLVAEVAERLAAATGMDFVVTPVRRAPRHKPVYHLMFGTRAPHGIWVFGDSVARATQVWWDTLEEVEAEQDDGALFSATSTIRPVLETVEREAVATIAENLATLLRTHGTFRVVDHPKAVFGDYYGKVRDTVVRSAVKQLHAAGRCSSSGVGVKRPRDIVVTPPAS